MLGRNPQSSKNATRSIVCSVKRAKQGSSIAQSNGVGTTGYAGVREADPLRPANLIKHSAVR
jgi:hypothetical protein